MWTQKYKDKEVNLPAREKEVSFLVRSDILVQREGIAYNTYELLP